MLPHQHGIVLRFILVGLAFLALGGALRACVMVDQVAATVHDHPDRIEAAVFEAEGGRP